MVNQQVTLMEEDPLFIPGHSSEVPHLLDGNVKMVDGRRFIKIKRNSTDLSQGVGSRKVFPVFAIQKEAALNPRKEIAHVTREEPIRNHIAGLPDIIAKKLLGELSSLKSKPTNKSFPNVISKNLFGKRTKDVARTVQCKRKPPVKKKPRSIVHINVRNSSRRPPKQKPAPLDPLDEVEVVNCDQIVARIKDEPDDEGLQNSDEEQCEYMFVNDATAQNGEENSNRSFHRVTIQDELHEFQEDESSSNSFQVLNHVTPELSARIVENGTQEILPLAEVKVEVDETEVILPDVEGTSDLMQLLQDHGRTANKKTKKHRSGLKVKVTKAIFTCSVCSKTFGLIQNYKRHLNSHSQDELSKVFKRKSDMYSDEDIQCSICNKSFKGKINLKKHLYAHLQEKKFECHVCHKRFRYMCLLRNHQSVHSMEKNYQCTVCNKFYNSEYDLKRHHKVHAGERMFGCSVCGKLFWYNSELKTHERIHSGEKPFACNLCPKMFTCKSNLKEHLRTHTGEKPFGCDICGRYFRSTSSLKAHRKTHTGEKDYSCPVCNKLFGRSNAVKKHLRTHTGEKPYLCDICKKAFTDSSSMQKHLKIHTGEKPYVCGICKKSFRANYGLKRHQRVHTGERPYTCEICGKTFRWKAHFKKHLEAHDKETESQV